MKKPAKKKGANPRICEDVIMSTLLMPITLPNTEALRTAATLAVIDAFDRGLTREAFIDMLNCSNELHNYLSRIRTIQAMHNMQKEGVLSEEVLTKAFDDLVKYSQAARSVMVRYVSVVQKCPTAADNVH